MEKIIAIPTKYKGIQFRSRLEARWAILFDLLKWDWEYEPFDLSGWIPDFIIKGNKDLLVEIKYFPLITESNGSYGYDERWVKQVWKIKKAEPYSSILLLSNSPFDNEGWSGTEEDCFGFILHDANDMKWTHESDVYLMDIREQILIWGSTCFIEENGPVSHVPDFCVKGSTDVVFESMMKERIRDMWNEAGNEVQYKKP